MSLDLSKMSLEEMIILRDKIHHEIGRRFGKQVEDSYKEKSEVEMKASLEEVFKQYGLDPAGADKIIKDGKK